MKRLTGIAAVIAGILVFSSVSSVSWEGRAVIAETSLFPSDGKYARSRVFSRGEMVDVYNPANETKTSVVIVGPSDVSGVLIMLSPQAAAELSISEGYDAIVRVNKKQLYTEPSILPGTDTLRGASPADTDTDPRAAVENRAPAGFRPLAAGTIPVPEQPSSIGLPQTETAPPPVPVISDEPRVVIQETGEAIPLVQPQISNISPVVTDVPVLQTRMASLPSPGEAVPDERIPPPPEESDDPILYTSIAAPPAANPEAEISHPVVPDFTDIPEMYSSAVAAEPEMQAITDIPSPELHDEPELYTHAESSTASIASGETESGIPADEPVVAVARTEREIHPSISVDIGDGEFILIPADMLPPEAVNTVGAAPAANGTLSAIAAVPPEIETEPIPLPEETAAKPDSSAVPASGTETLPVTPGILSIPQELSPLCITELERNRYYIQLAALHDVQNISALVSVYGRSYPIKLRSPTADTCQVLVGPLEKDEYGAVLERFRNHGFADAFVRGIK